MGFGLGFTHLELLKVIDTARAPHSHFRIHHIPEREHLGISPFAMREQ